MIFTNSDEISVSDKLNTYTRKASSNFFKRNEIFSTDEKLHMYHMWSTTEIGFPSESVHLVNTSE